LRLTGAPTNLALSAGRVGVADPVARTLIGVRS
jgi:hypothetical protein